ncbi:F-box family protein [Rhynchospora pubera]|uniref:F-box family protein n=1 Tax=Rhynchospora pubera TaxID=906938 RepID=A0AAV8G525_9POAL|nr:F-box family protein [Rhynchospora pubera]
MSTSSKRGRGRGRGRGRRLIQHERNSKDMKASNEENWCGAFPDDVVVDILSRLPPKLFYRSKCVSKTWLALSSAAFPLNKNLQPTLLGFFHGAISVFRRNLGFTNISDRVHEIDATLRAFSYHDEVEIIDCCNGLVLVKCCSIEPSFESRDMYVYNPATRKRTAIELMPKVYFEDETYSEIFSLAFDPQDQSHFYVISLQQWHSPCLSYDNSFYIFSSATGKWQRGGNMECVSKVTQNTKGTFLDGKVHRVTEGHQIVSIDPKNNTFLVTKFDFPGLQFRKDLSEIGQSQGLLHFMYVNEESHRLLIWVPENGNQQNWILKHQLNLEGMHLGNVSVKNVKLHPGKDVIFVLGENGRILSIDLNDGEPNKIYYLRNPSCSSFWLYTPCFPV